MELYIGSQRKATAVRSRAKLKEHLRPNKSQRRGIRHHDSTTTVYDQSGQIAASFAGQRVTWRGAEGKINTLAVFKRTSPMVRHIDFYALDGEPLQDCICAFALVDPSRPCALVPVSILVLLLLRLSSARINTASLASTCKAPESVITQGHDCHCHLMCSFCTDALPHIIRSPSLLQVHVQSCLPTRPSKQPTS